MQRPGGGLARERRGSGGGAERRRRRRVTQGRRRGRVACGEEARAERFWLNPWVQGGIGRGRDVWPARWPRRRTDAVVGVVQGGER